MDVRSLKLFLALAQSLHFGRAAESVNLSPSALSRAIRRLEDELGCRLFARNNREVRLTAEGGVLLAQAEDLLERLQSLERRLRAGAEQLQGTVSLYCSVTASYSLLAGLLPEFRERHPGIEVKVHTGDEASALNRVLQGREDIAIAARPERWPARLNFLELATTPLVFIAPGVPSPQEAALGAGPDDRSRAAWEQLPMILPETGLARDRIDAWFASTGLRPNIYAQVSGNEAIVGMVALGFGVGVVPLLVLKGSPFAERVRVLDVLPELAAFRIGLCCRASALGNPLVMALWSLAAERGRRG